MGSKGNSSDLIYVLVDGMHMLQCKYRREQQVVLKYTST